MHNTANMSYEQKNILAWEDPDVKNVFSKFFITYFQLLTRPNIMLRNMQNKGKVPPFLFYLTTSFLVAVIISIGFKMTLTYLPILFPSSAQQFSFLSILFFMLIITAIGAPLFLFASSAYYHIFFRLAGVGAKRFETTFRVVAYMGPAATLWFFGHNIGFIPGFAYYIAAFKNAHSLSYKATIIVYIMALIPPTVGAVFMKIHMG